MILKTFYSIEINKLDGQLPARLSQNEYINFCIRSDDTAGLEAALSFLYTSTSKNFFSVCIEETEQFTPSCISNICRSLVLLAFHYKYVKFQFNTPLFFIRENQSSFLNVATQFKKEFIKQGFIDLECQNFRESRTTVSFEGDKENFYESLRIKYQNALRSFSVSNDTLFISVSSVSELSQAASFLNQYEQEIFQSNEHTFRLITDISDLKKKQTILSVNCGDLEQRLLSSQSYQSSDNPIQSEHVKKIKEIVGFYKNEYEILPLWYKKIGHIIKVITGKRTFKSLYDKNAKKYKD